MTKYPFTGADEMTSMLLDFPSAPSGLQPAHGIALTNFRVADDPDGHNSVKPAIRIQGPKGELQVDGPAYSPTNYRIIPKGDGTQPVSIEKHEYPRPRCSMFWRPMSVRGAFGMENWKATCWIWRRVSSS